jgi:hypothetical protein
LRIRPEIQTSTYIHVQRWPSSSALHLRSLHQQPAVASQENAHGLEATHASGVTLEQPITGLEQHTVSWGCACV